MVLLALGLTIVFNVYIIPTEEILRMLPDSVVKKLVIIIFFE
jgi:hypothetical protein